MANEANIPINQVGRIERGEINTTIYTLFNLCNALNVSLTEFLAEVDIALNSKPNNPIVIFSKGPRKSFSNEIISLDVKNKDKKKV